MSLEETPVVPVPAPVVPQPVVAPTPAAVTPAPVPAPAPPAPTPAPTPAEPAYLSDRLKRAQRTVLKELGFKVKKDADISAAIVEAKSKLSTSSERRRELDTKLSALETEVTSLKERDTAWSAFVATTLGELTPEQKTLVASLAGNDPAKQISTLAHLRSSGLLTKPVVAAPPVPATAAPAAAPAIPDAPANTLPPVSPTPTQGDNIDYTAEYKRLFANPKPNRLEDAQRKLFLISHSGDVDFSKIIKN